MMQRIALVIAAATLACGCSKAGPKPSEGAAAGDRTAAPAPAAKPAGEAAPAPAPVDEASAAAKAAVEAAAKAATLDAGDYGCRFGGYAEFLCRVEVDGKFVTLEKLGGTERLRGSLMGDGSSVQWVNAVPDSDPAALTFKRQPDGTWFAEVPSDGEKVGYRLRRLGALGSQFGGQSYAGAISEPPSN